MRGNIVTACCSAVLVAGGLLLGPAALAAPTPGSPDCDDLVTADRAVVDLTAQLEVVDDAAQEADLTARLRAAVDAAELRLCTDSSTPAPTVAPPTSGTAPPAAPPVDEVLTRIAALGCGPSFAADRGRVLDDISTLILAGGSAEQVGRLSDALRQREQALGFCAPATAGPTEVPLGSGVADDGSVPSGSQVQAPLGSVDTGAP